METVPPSIVLATPSWAPPSTRTTSPQALNALGHRKVDGLEVQELLERRDQLGEVEPIGVRYLLDQVIAADEVLCALVAEVGDDPLHLLAHRLEEPRAALRCAVDGLGGELLEA